MITKLHLKKYELVNDNYIEMLNLIADTDNVRTASAKNFLAEYTLESNGLGLSDRTDKYLDTNKICARVNNILVAMPEADYSTHGIEKKQNATQTWLVWHGLCFCITQRKAWDVKEDIHTMLKTKGLDGYEYLRVSYKCEKADMPLDPKVWVRPGGNEGHLVLISDDSNNVMMLKTFEGMDVALRISNEITKFLWEN